jgi:hypothetical protein
MAKRNMAFYHPIIIWPGHILFFFLAILFVIIISSIIVSYLFYILFFISFDFVFFGVCFFFCFTTFLCVYRAFREQGFFLLCKISLSCLVPNNEAISRSPFVILPICYIHPWENCTEWFLFLRPWFAQHLAKLGSQRG